MNAFAQLRAQLNVIHGELAARGIHSTKIENATYSIETLSKAYMETEVPIDWIRNYKFTKTEQRISAILHKRMGKCLHRDALLEAMYFDNQERADNLVDARKIVDVFICKMRRHLKKFNAPFVIETIRAEGFRMVLKPSALALTALQELQAH